MADFLLAEGLGAATLRPLAEAAGTSDRMLLYYFKDKDEILAAVFQRVTERLTAELDKAIPAGKPRSFDRLFTEVWEVLSSEALLPFMPLWLELAATAARGLEPHRTVAGQIADGFIAWIAQHLEGTTKSKRLSEAAAFMVLVEGMYMLHAIGRPDVSASAKTLLRGKLR